MQKALRMINQFLSRIIIAISLAFFVFIVFFGPDTLKSVGKIGLWTVIVVLEILFVVGLIWSKSPKSR
jgi:amino acid transporter